MVAFALWLAAPVFWADWPAAVGLPWVHQFGARSSSNRPDDTFANHRQARGEVFDAYNRCDLAAFSKFFAANVEFYHDTGGATFDRRTVVENTRKHICNKVRRELIPSSVKVCPIKNFGAIAEGEHRFCPITGEACEGAAKFLIVWRQGRCSWRITRVISYGHRALVDGE